MDKWGALHAFWSSFGLPAYDATTVPEEIYDETTDKMVPLEPPYITYEAKTAGIDEKVGLTASLWYRSTSWADISQKAEAIGAYIGGGAGVNYDGGRLWITKEVPFAQRMAEPSDDFVRRIVLQVSGEFQ